MTQTYSEIQIVLPRHKEPSYDFSEYTSPKESTGSQTVVYRVVLEQDEDGRFIVTCPELQGVVTDGATEKEALQNIRDAIEAVLEDMEDMKEFNIESYYKE